MSSCSKIPIDYAGVMGVPVSFFFKYNPDEFEIIGRADASAGKEMGVGPYDRRLRKLNPSLTDGTFYYVINGIPIKPFSRIAVRNRHPIKKT